MVTKQAWQPDLRDRSITVERIEAIGFTPMPGRLRNELITQAYGDLADAMADVMGTEDITWSVLGVWASSTIGGYLNVPIPILGRIIARPFADGNRDVFTDIGRAQAIFLSTVGEAHLNGDDVDLAWRKCRRQLRRDDLLEPPGRVRGEVDRFWDTIPDDPTLEGTRNTGQQALTDGFGAYKLALQVDDPEERSKLILLGNLVLALHEQRHLSMPISLGFRMWLRTMLQWSRPLEPNRHWMNRDPKQWRVDAENWWIETATRHFVGVALPDEKIRVCNVVPAGSNPVPYVPPTRLDPDSPPLEPVAAPLPDDEPDRPRRKKRRRGTRQRRRRARGRRTGAHRVGPAGQARPESPEEMLDRLFVSLKIDGSPATNWNALSDRMAYVSALFVENQRSDRWWQGTATIRPDQWKRFETELDRQRTRMELPPPIDVSALAATSPLSSDDLSELRTRLSEPELPNDRLSYDRLRDPAERSELVAALESDLDARLDTVLAPGGLLDPATCRRARAVFTEWEILIMMGLLFRSLPDAYAAADGVHAIGESTSHLATDPFRRSGETAHFIRDLLLNDDGWDDGTFRRDGAAYDSIRGLRGMHAMVSAALLRKKDWQGNPSWDAETYGMPLNQEDMLGTALSFVIPVFEMMDDMGIEVDAADREAYLHLWLGVGHLLGAPIEAVTVVENGVRRGLTWAEAQGVAATIRGRHHRRSMHGVRLTEALLEGVADGFPRRFRWLAPGLMQALGDPTVTTLLLAGYGPGRRRAAIAAGFLRVGFRFRLTRPLTLASLRFGGGRWLKPFLDGGTGRPYRTPVKAKRQPPIGAFVEEYWPVGWPGQYKAHTATIDGQH